MVNIQILNTPLQPSKLQNLCGILKFVRYTIKYQTTGVGVTNNFKHFKFFIVLYCIKFIIMEDININVKKKLYNA